MQRFSLDSTFPSLPALGALLILVMSSSALYAQPGGRVWVSDPRVEDRTYVFEETGEALPYCLYVSSKITAGTPAPLIITLHGLGGTPQVMCNTTAVDLAEAGGYILASPMGYNRGGWYGSPVMQFRREGEAADPDAMDPELLAQYSEKDVLNVLAMVREEFNVDPNRIYLTGHSMGGAGTYFLGAKHTGIWAAIAPVAPAAFLIADDRAEHLQQLADADIPVMVVHGDIDEAVPVATSHAWVATMEEIGVEHTYVELPGVTHGPVIADSQEHIYRFFEKHSK